MLSKIVRTVANQLVLFILIFGLYVIAHGHLTPGGGFQGGAVVVSGVVMLLVAFSSQDLKKSVRERVLSIMESTGALIFAILGFAGLGTVFFYNFLVGSPIFGRIPPTGPNSGDFWTGGFIPLMNFAVGLKVIAGLSAVVLAIALFARGEEMEE
ncbi:MAG: sodium:proton antiporter [Dehalococcoidia bacterium]|nr:sodium:proton antiporter [Dehalococcoidia bacterium]MDH4367639.1 sodium:proton antiporter [Dehalococcoidia bacterium]